MKTQSTWWGRLFHLAIAVALAAAQGCGSGSGGGGDADTSAPRVVSAEAVSQDEVLVTFDEALKNCSARTANFTITPALDVADAGLRNGGKAVWLKTGRQVRDLPPEGNFQAIPGYQNEQPIEHHLYQYPFQRH